MCKGSEAKLFDKQQGAHCNWGRKCEMESDGSWLQNVQGVNQGQHHRGYIGQRWDDIKGMSRPHLGLESRIIVAAVWPKERWRARVEAGKSLQQERGTVIHSRIMVAVMKRGDKRWRVSCKCRALGFADRLERSWGKEKSQGWHQSFRSSHLPRWGIIVSDKCEYSEGFW